MGGCYEVWTRTKGLCGFTQSIMVDCSLSLVTVRKRISEYTRFTNFSNLLSPNTHTHTHIEGPQLYSEDLEPSIIPMLLTNIDGARSYATGLRFSRPFFIQKPDKGRYYNLVPWKDSMQPPPNSRLIYLPTCCVLVSQHPYFKFMKDALSGYI